MEEKEKLENMLILPEFAKHCNNKRSFNSISGVLLFPPVNLNKS